MGSFVEPFFVTIIIVAMMAKLFIRMRMHLMRNRAVAILGSIAFVASCQDGVGPADRVAFAVNIVSGDSQAGTVGKELP